MKYLSGESLSNSAIHTVFAPLYYLFDPDQRIYWPFLLTSTGIALWLYLAEKLEGKPNDQGIVRYLLPKEVFFHKSAKADYLLFCLNAVLYSLILAPFFALYSLVSLRLSSFLVIWTGSTPQDLPANTWTAVAYTLSVALAFDFALFLSHLIQHRIPILWQFHKVHHSARVMTPITVYRMHPIDDIISITFTSVLGGLVDGLFRFFVMPNVKPFTVVTLNIIFFVFYSVGYHLRHSHIWLSYGPTWSKIFISPAQHQIHHSKAREHWNANFGFMFAFWDWACRSLYVPKTREQIEFGIGEEEEVYSSVKQLYLTPFRNAYKILRGEYYKPGEGRRWFR